MRFSMVKVAMRCSHFTREIGECRMDGIDDDNSHTQSKQSKHIWIRHTRRKYTTGNIPTNRLHNNKNVNIWCGNRKTPQNPFVCAAFAYCRSSEALCAQVDRIWNL